MVGGGGLEPHFPKVMILEAATCLPPVKVSGRQEVTM